VKGFLRWTGLVLALSGVIAVADPEGSESTARVGWFAIAAGGAIALLLTLRHRLPRSIADPFLPRNVRPRPDAVPMRYAQLRVELRAMAAGGDRARITGLLRATLRDLVSWKLAHHGVAFADDASKARAQELLGEPLWLAVTEGVPPADPHSLVDALEAL